MPQPLNEATESDNDLFDIIERFYGAVTQPNSWLEACTALVGRFGGETATLFLDGPNGIVPIAFPGFSDQALRLYGEHYHKVDLWAVAGRRLRRPRDELLCYLGHDLVPAAEFSESEVWQDFSRHHVGAFHLVGSEFTIDHGSHAMIGLNRPRDAEEFGLADARRLRLLLPHLRNALFLMHRLETAEDLAKAGFGALEHLSSGIAILDRAHHVIFANAAMERLGAAGDVQLRPDVGGIRPGRRMQLSLSHPSDHAQFMGLVEHAARLGAGGGMQLCVAETDRRLDLLVMPLPHKLSPHSPSGGIFDSGKVLLIVRDHAHPVALKADLLKALYGLTEAEVGVVQLLLGGRTAEAVAADRGVSVPTIRTQIRHILEKAGVRSLRELEGLISAP